MGLLEIVNFFRYCVVCLMSEDILADVNASQGRVWERGLYLFVTLSNDLPVYLTIATRNNCSDPSAAGNLATVRMKIVYMLLPAK